MELKHMDTKIEKAENWFMNLSSKEAIILYDRYRGRNI